MELPDFVLIAEAVAPPSTQIVNAIAAHALEEFPTAICCAHQLLFFLSLSLFSSRRAVLLNVLRYYGYAAKVPLTL
jgi:hypothetical protein